MQSTDPLGRVTRSFYDTQGRVLKREFDDFTSVLTEYDALGNRTAETNPLGERRRFHYDTQGRLVGVTLPVVVDPATGESVQPRYTYGHDVYGNQTSITDPLGRTTRFTFDHQGRQLTRTLPAGLTERTIYDDRSLLDVTAAGEPLERSTALGQTEYAIDFEGRVTAYRYDNTALGGGRLVAKLYYAAEAAYLADRADGTLTSAVERVELSYDAHGREVASRFYRQDETTDLTTTTYDAEGRTIAVASPEGTVTYEYDALGRKTAVSTGDPLAPTTRTEYGYDTLGRLETVAAAWLDGVDVADQVTTYRYDKAGRLDALLRPGDLVTDYVYDALGRLDVLTDFLDADRDAALDDGEMVLARYDYDLRADGKRVGVTEIDDLGRTTRIDWAYDALGRLAGERYDSFEDSEDYTSEFAYDLASNRTEKRVDRGSDGTIDVVTRSVFDASDRTLTETTDSRENTEDRFTRFEFTGTQQTRKTVYRGITDNNPRESDTRYEYNLQGALGRVVARQYGDTGILIAESATEFQYDEDGVRVSETDVNSGTRREFLIDHQNPTGHAKPIEERASGLLIRSYTLGSTVLAQHGAQGTTQPGSKLLLLDSHGSTRLLLDLATAAILQRYRYTADGLPIGFDPSTAQTNFLFGGDSQYNQATQLYYHLARWRQAGGAWLTLDPYAGNLEDPLSLNKYLYVHGDEVSLYDPSGKSGVDRMLASMGVFVVSRLLLGSAAEFTIRNAYLNEVNDNESEVNVRSQQVGRKGDQGLAVWLEVFLLRPDILDKRNKTYYEIKSSSDSGTKEGLAKLRLYDVAIQHRYPGEKYTRGLWKPLQVAYQLQVPLWIGDFPLPATIQVYRNKPGLVQYSQWDIDRQAAAYSALAAISPSHATALASRLLSNPAIPSVIRAQVARLAANTTGSQSLVRLAENSFGSIGKLAFA